MSSYLRTLTTWHCPHSHAAAAPVGRYLLPAGSTAATLAAATSLLLRAHTLGQTDGQTDGRRTRFNNTPVCFACQLSTQKKLPPPFCYHANRDDSRTTYLYSHPRRFSVFRPSTTEILDCIFYLVSLGRMSPSEVDIHREDASVYVVLYPVCVCA